MYCKRHGVSVHWKKVMDLHFIRSLCQKRNGQIIAAIDCRKSMDTQLSMQKGKTKGHSLSVFCKKKKEVMDTFWHHSEKRGDGHTVSIKVMGTVRHHWVQRGNGHNVSRKVMDSLAAFSECTEVYRKEQILWQYCIFALFNK